MRGEEIGVVLAGMKAMPGEITEPSASALGIQCANRPIRAFGFGRET